MTHDPSPANDLDEPSDSGAFVLSVYLPGQDVDCIARRSPSAFLRLLRWTVINHGFFGLDKPTVPFLETDAERPSIVRIRLVSGQETVSIQFDWSVGLGLLVFARGDWTSANVESANGVINWLVSEAVARRPAIISAPNLRHHSHDLISDDTTIDAHLDTVTRLAVHPRNDA